jgi:hypothetical protein
LRQKDPEFKASLSYIVRSYLKKWRAGDAVRAKPYIGFPAPTNR